MPDESIISKLLQLIGIIPPVFADFNPDLQKDLFPYKVLDVYAGLGGSFFDGIALMAQDDGFL